MHSKFGRKPVRDNRKRDDRGSPADGTARSKHRVRRYRLLLLGALLLIASGVGAVRAAGPPAAADAAPAVEEWLNQPVRLRDTAMARERPTADGKPAGEIRSGAEVKALALVAGRSWVQIELPNHALAYLPRAAVEFETGGGAGAPPPPTGKPAPAAAPPAAAAAPPAATAGEPIGGAVSRVPNAATLVVGDQRIRLSGIDPGPSSALGPFAKWVAGQGVLACRPAAQTGRYRCLTDKGLDVAEAAILNGAGRVGDGAPPSYRDSETQARNAKRGLWGQP